MNIGIKHKLSSAGKMIPALFVCLSVSTLMAQEPGEPVALLDNGTISLISQSADPANAAPDSFTLMLDQDGGLDFDLGGSETRKLQLKLDQPLSLTTGTNARVLDFGGNQLGLDATLNAPVTERFNLSAGVEKQFGEARFQSLGSIQCLNGVLRADSYTASGCRFVNEPLAASEQTRINLGASMDLSNASASINWFTQDAEFARSPVNRVNPYAGQAVLGNNLLSPNLGNPLLADVGTDPLQYLNSEASGINLNFKVGFTTDNSGDVRLGLAFSRVLEANYDGLYSGVSEALSWTLAEPFNTAQMNLEWSRGSFSSGIQGYYRDSVDFLDRKTVDSLTTFDVHFTWRTPWNANLSVGASNVLNAGTENIGTAESQPVDPMESVYGRIPYVRYKQDL
jgi:hypothetical protein